MNLSLFSPKDEAEMLFGPPWLLTKNEKSIDFFTRSSIAKFANKSKKFASLAESTNTSVVFENEKNFKKLFVKTKII